MNKHPAKQKNSSDESKTQISYKNFECNHEYGMTFQNDIANELYLSAMNKLGRYLKETHNLGMLSSQADFEDKTPLIICAKISGANDRVLNYLIFDVAVIMLRM